MQKIGDIPNTRADSNGEFTDGNVAGGIPPTILPAEWFNTIQHELINVLAAAGITPDSAKFDQVATAVSKLITDGGFLKTVNNLSEIKTAGTAAVAQTLANLGLSDVAHLPQLTGVVGTSRNAKMSVTAVSTTATFTADELIVQAALGGRQYKLTSFNKTINLATTGAGGMDTGTAPATGWVALYAIYNPTNQASALVAVNATTVTAPEVYGGANMPTGYTASALVSVWKTTLASLLDAGEQRDRHIDIRRSSIMTVSTEQSSYTQVTSSLLTPINAKTIYGDLQAVGGSSVIYAISPRSDEIGAVSFQFGVGASQSLYRISITSPQKFSYKFIGGTTLNIWTSGYDS